MKFLKSTLMGAGGVLLAGLTLTLLAPKAAHALAATLVQVTNTVANPVPTVATDNPALQPFVQFRSGQPGILDLVFSAPAGQTWAIETMSLDCMGSPPAPATDVELFFSTGGAPVHYTFAPAVFFGNTELILTQSVRAYADPGSQVVIGSGSNIPSGWICGATLSGHLVNPI